MIDLTDEMRDAVKGRMGIPRGVYLDPWMEAALQDVLALVERDLPNQHLNADGTHRYLSTSCLHDQHDYCKATTGRVGPKTPAVCKFCGAPCICTCHDQNGRS